jgi:membrane protein implicated in regulation of membrane protease activity
MALAWLVAAILFGILEVATVAFFAVFIAAGALAAALVAQLGAGIVVQVLVFGMVSLLGLIALRPFAVRRLRHRGHALVSGADAMLGQHVVVVDAIPGTGEPGHVLISGERWPAISGNGATIEPGRTVVVLELRRTTLVVAPL